MRKKSGKPTIKDVAALAGVSVGTVSRVMNNKGYLSEETRNKVFEAVNATGFVPNLTAQSMVSQKIPIIGVIVPEINNPFLSYLVAYIDKYLHNAGYSIMLCNNQYNMKTTCTFIDRLLQLNVTGLILIASTIDDPDYLSSIQKKMHIICINASLENTDCINSTDWQSTFELTEYLLKLGHCKIAYFGFNHASPPTIERLRGYSDALMKHHIPLRPEYILSTDDAIMVPNTHENVLMPANALAAKLLDLPDPPTAMMAINDYYALSAYTEIWRRGLVVGRDVSVIGYDDILLTQIVTPKMTTVHCDGDSLAYVATSTLLDRLKEGAMPREPRNIMVPGTIIKRHSVSPPPART